MGLYPELKGKAAIVTGATAGIGKSIATLLAEEGVNVAAIGRDRERGSAVEAMLREPGTESFFARCDVSSPEEVESAYSDIARRLGRVDILVNCAGGFPRPALVSEYSVADWDELLNSNLRSAFLLTRLVLPGMVDQKWGRIVNISSGAALSVSYLTSAIYAAAKAGMLGFTRHVAAEVAPYGVTVNATTPGLTMSERIAKIYTPEMTAERLKHVPVGRMSQPEEQAAAVLFLCSGKAAFITGATLNVSGGMVYH
jgi:NAD(P)-dependent dehydrogenase (short-subunit alcohol dehydrogenase family)